MQLRAFIHQAEQHQWVIHVDTPTEPDEGMARMMYRAGDQILFFRSRWNGYRVISGVCASRRYFALAFGVDERALCAYLVKALQEPAVPPIVPSAPCQEVVEDEVNLEAMPIVRHTPHDGGPYITAGIALVYDPARRVINAAFHRLMRLDRRRLAVRLVEGRHTHAVWSSIAGDVPVAICIGAPLSVQLAAAMSPAGDIPELHIAHSLAPTPLVRCVGSDLLVPAESEIVLEGRITHELVDEGPFIDLTGTFDIVRPQPVIEIDRITRRRDPIYQALLPGGPEHQTLMGMPREPTIFAAVNQVCECLNVWITPGGASWLHAVVQIRKRRPDDGRRAGEAAFRGHGSLKHVVVVDEDINPFDVKEVEWAIATRVQADRDIIIWSDQPSSSLDPSARHIPGQKARTAKMAVDATIPWDDEHGPRNPEAFQRFRYE
ncbi:MAG: UbiD family decarboxylase [Anaerolineae bacterium]